MNIKENENAVELILEMFYKLYEDENVILSLQKDNYSENTSYLSEYPSMIIFLCYIHNRKGVRIESTDIDKKINKYAACLVETIKGNETNNSSLCYGFVGIAHAFNYCYKRTGKFKNIINVIEERLADLSCLKLQQIYLRGISKTREEDYDIIQGLSSVVIYFLKKRDLTKKQDKLVGDILDYFVSLMKDTEGKINITIKPDEMIWEYLKMEYPDGFINLSVSHGILGPMYSLCLGYIRYKLDRYKMAIDSGLKIYRQNLWIKHDFVKGKTLYGWSERADTSERKSGYKFNKSWCYGSLGMARVLYIISKKLGNVSMQELCIEVVKSVMDYPVASNMRNTNAICHGNAGMMMIFDRMYQDTKINKFKEISKSLFDTIIQQASYDNEYIFVERDVYFRGKLYQDAIEYVDLGMLNGNTGIIMALLGHVYEDYEPLNSMFIA